MQPNACDQTDPLLVWSGLVPPAPHMVVPGPTVGAPCGRPPAPRGRGCPGCLPCRSAARGSRRCPGPSPPRPWWCPPPGTLWPPGAGLAWQEEEEEEEEIQIYINWRVSWLVVLLSFSNKIQCRSYMQWYCPALFVFFLLPEYLTYIFLRLIHCKFVDLLFYCIIL